MQQLLEIQTHNPLIWTMKHHRFIVSNQMEELFKVQMSLKKAVVNKQVSDITSR